MMAREAEVLEFEDAEALAREGARRFADLARDSVSARGRFSVALTGGSSPVQLYRALAEPRYADEIPWRDVHLFWGDERVVPPGHPRSNFRLSQRLFIERVPIPSGNVHRVRGELGVRGAVAAYRAELAEHLGDEPRFDLVHLGLGSDGHVASLFPFDASTLLDRQELVLPALYCELGEWRVTLTYRVLNASARVEFLLPDATKAPIARLAMGGPIDPLRVPAQGVRPESGELVWCVTAGVLAAIEGDRR